MIIGPINHRIPPIVLHLSLCHFPFQTPCPQRRGSFWTHWTKCQPRSRWSSLKAIHKNVHVHCAMCICWLELIRTQRKCQLWFSQGLKRENLLRRSSTVVWRYFLFLMCESFAWGSPKKMWNGNFAVASEAPCQAGVGSTFPCGSTSQVKVK